MKRNEKRDERDVGRLAEKTFEVWMEQTAVTCNPVDSDKEGWDYFLQFPFEVADDLPLDLRNPRIECVVQVKGIGVEGKARKKVTLSNWEKLTKSLLPAFFVIIDFKQEREPQEAFLVHVDQAWIGRATKRLRELSPSEREKTNKKYLYLTWTEQNQLPSLDGPALATAMESHIGPDIESYSDEKRKLREAVGDPISAELSLSFAADDEDDMWTKFVDLMIGEQTEIETVKGTIRENIRYGIPAKEEQFGPGGRLEITDTGGFPIQIVFSNADGNHRASFSGQAVTPYFHPMVEQIPKEHIRERAVFQFGRVLIQPALRILNMKIKLPEPDALHSLDDLANIWRLVTLMWQEPNDPLFIEFQNNDGKRMFFQQLPVRLTDQIGEDELSATRQMASVVDNAWYLAKHVGVPFDTQLSTEQIRKQGRLLHFLRQLIDVNLQAGPITGALDPEAPVFDDQRAIVFMKEILFGDVSALICLGLSGKLDFAPAEEDGSRPFTICRPQVVSLNSRIARRNDSNFEETASSLIETSTINLEERGISVIA